MALTKVLVAVLVLVLVGGVAFFYLRGLDEVGVQSFSITGLKDIGANTFTLTADLVINNPSGASIPIKSVTYDVILKDTGESIAKGVIPAFTLAANAATTVPLEQKIAWGPTAQLALLLASQDSVYVTVAGNVVVDLPELRERPLPFSDEVDVKEKLTGTPSEGGGGILKGFETTR